jgi:hypothetical protein
VRLWSQEKATRHEAPGKSRGLRVKSQEEILQTVRGGKSRVGGSSYVSRGIKLASQIRLRDPSIQTSMAKSLRVGDHHFMYFKLQEQARAAQSATI